MQRLLRCALSICLLVPYAAPALADGSLACDIPADLVTPSDALPHLAAALAKSATVNILALGSGSTVGDSGGASGPALAYHVPGKSFPYLMVDALQAMRPNVRFQLIVKGARSMTAEVMLPILQQELTAHHYDLVLWQTGTVEAVHGSRPDALRDVLQDGADATQQAQADLVLIDPQFSRFFRANADLNPYESVLQQMTGNPDVTLFHRFDLTQSWASSGQIDVERVEHDKRDKSIELLNACLGQALAQYVLNGANDHS